MKYLNHDSQLNILWLASMEFHLDRMIKEWETQPHMKDNLKNARMSKTYVAKTLNFITGRLDYKSLMNVKELVRKYTTVIKYTKNAESDIKHQRKLESNLVVDYTDMQLLMEFAKVSCGVCESCGKDVLECPVYSVFMKYNAQIENELADVDNGGCPYRTMVISQQRQDEIKQAWEDFRDGE